MCWLPSISTINLRSRQQKSTVYRPIGSCLTNLNPARRRSRNTPQMRPSASLRSRRCRREKLVAPGLLPRTSCPFPHAPPPPPPPPSGGRGPPPLGAPPLPAKGEGPPPPP